MPDRRGRKGAIETGRTPAEEVEWAREIWKDRYQIARLQSGAWLLREAADVLGIADEIVDEVLRPR